MRVKIIPPKGCDRSALDERGWADIREGAVLRDALRIIALSPMRARLLLISINGERASLNTPLCNGDVIGFFSLCTGG